MKQQSVRVVLAIAAVIAVMGAATSVPAAAQADDNGTDPQPYSEIYQWYVARGVDDVTAAHLTQNILDGVMPMSSQAGSVAVSEETHRDGAWVVTLRRFADGSVTESRIEQPSPQAFGSVVPMSVGSCEGIRHTANSINYSNCRVEERSSYLTLSFRADYTQAYGVGVIDAVRQPYQYAVWGTASTPSLSITRKSSSTYGAATAVGRSTFSHPYGSGTVDILLKVTGTAASSSRSGF